MKVRPRISRPSWLRIGSVGSKLAGATFALMIVVTIGIYLGLSRYQRENLLRAKESAALALTRLFTDSCVAPVVFEDDSAVDNALATLGRNDEVQYAAVWSADATGKRGRRIAELARGPSVVVERAPGAMALERQPARFVIVSPVRDQDHVIVAVAVVTVSLERENRAIAEVESRTLAVSSGVALGLTLLLMAMVRLLIVRPLGKLVVAANRLEDGGSVEIDVATDDEVGQLATAFRSMADAIRVREERITARNRDMQLLLDNVGQGFITLDLEGSVSKERSRIVDEWFGPADDSPKFWDYLARVDSSVGERFNVSWDSVREDILPLELALDQLPHAVTRFEQTFELAYRPIFAVERLDKVVVVITDITARIEREHAEQGQREMMSIFQRVLADRHVFDEFFAEASQLVDSITAWEGEDLSVLKRHVHTLKGNCSFFGLESIVRFCDAAEDSMEHSGLALDRESKQTLRTLWSAVGQVLSQLTGSSSEETIALSHDEYEEFLTELRNPEDRDVVVARAVAWRFEPASKRLAFIAEQTRRAASRLGKAPVVVTCHPTRLRLASGSWTSFWSVFAHVIRNTVDHGLETVEERQLARKAEQGAVSLGIGREGERLVLTIEDDGRGIDWSKLAERAKDRGLPHSTRADLEAALFTSGISTRSQATTTSGRGIGMAAVRDVVNGLGGHIEIKSEPGAGTTFRFVLPLSMVGETSEPRSATVASANRK